MHNKWYSLTRPAVVHFNPPRDSGAVVDIGLWPASPVLHSSNKSDAGRRPPVT